MAKKTMTFGELVQRAESLYNEKRYDEAVGLLTVAIPDKGLTNDQRASLIYSRGFTWIAKGETDKVLSDFEIALAIDDISPETRSLILLQRGDFMRQQGRLMDGIDDYTRVTQMEGLDAERLAQTLSNRAVAWGEAGERDKELEDIATLLALDGVPPKLAAVAYFNRGVVWHDKGDDERAIADYTSAIELPGAPLEIVTKALFNRAKSLGRQGNPSESILDLTKAIETPGISMEDLFSCINERAITWKEKSKRISDCTRVIEAPEASNELKIVALLNRAFTWMETSKQVEDYTTALGLVDVSSDRKAWAYYYRGLAKDGMGDKAGALVDYDSVVNLQDSPPEQIASTLLNRGIIWDKLGDPSKAVADFSSILRLKNVSIENCAKAHYNSGYVMMKEGKVDEGCAEYSAALELKENLDPSFYYLMQLLTTLQEVDRSEIRARCLKIWFSCIELIRSIASDQIESETHVAHYTSLHVADLIVTGEDSRLRYNNAAYMNDPQEGKVLLDYFFDKTVSTAFGVAEKIEENHIYLGSFLPASDRGGHEDDLVMWRTYGKDEQRNEAAGCSLVIDAKFFDKERDFIRPELRWLPLNKEEEENMLKESQALYRVLYYDFRNSQFVCANSSRVNDIMVELNHDLTDLITIYQSSNIIYPVIAKIVYLMISELRYFFKSADYAFENELRLIQFVSPESDSVKIDKSSGGSLPRKLYIESNKPIQPFIKKIILGPKVVYPDQWIYLSAQLKKKKILVELRFSTCSFQ